METDIDTVLIDRAEIAIRVRELAAQIAGDLATADVRHPTIVPILTGSFIFAADLIRHLPNYVQIRLISISSYPGTAMVSQGATVKGQLTNLPDHLGGSDVLVIDDILDSGRTLRLVVETLERRGAGSVRTCVLLRKQRPEAMATPVDYVAFDIPDVFVVGYGLDFNDYYRNLPDIVSLREEVIEGASDGRAGLPGQ